MDAFHEDVEYEDEGEFLVDDLDELLEDDEHVEVDDLEGHVGVLAGGEGEEEHRVAEAAQEDLGPTSAEAT